MTQQDNREIVMREDDFIVSKTDPKGKITYGNRVFIEFSGYREQDLLGQPHNIIRHPDMPRSVYRLLWDTLQQGEEFFGLVKNRCKDGRFYWTFAHVTPSYCANGDLLGYYSVRRCPRRESIDIIAPIYQQMLIAEAEHDGSKQAMNASSEILQQHVQQSGKNYNEFVFTLEK